MNKPQISIECYHKLNRAKSIADYLHSDLLHRPINGMHQLYIPHIFSYIHDDMEFVLDELKVKGLCDEWLRQERNNLVEE